jgi:hypothetical protein
MTLIRGSLISGCAMVLALACGCGRTTGLGQNSSAGAGGVLVTGGAGGVLVTGGAGGVPAFGGSTATGGQGGAGTASPCTDALGTVVQGYLFTCPNDYTSAERWPATCSSGHGHLGSCNGFLALLVSPGTWGKECYYDPVSRVLVGAVAQDDVPDFCGQTSFTLAGGSYPSDCPLALLADLGDCVRATGGAGPSTGGAGGMGGMGGAGGAGGTGGMPGSGGTTATAGQTACSSSEPCTQGLCVGASCGDTWTCVVDGRDCTGSLVDYCGCDGVIFQDSWACPTRPYSYSGACPPGSANCDQRAVACKMLPPICDQGQFPRVVGSCWDGTCVPIEQCQCTVTEECPDPGNFVCWSQQHCGSLGP